MSLPAELRDRLETLNADLAIDEWNAAAAVWLACDLLVAGVDTPAVVELAGESPTRLLLVDAEPLVERMLAELGFSLLTEEQGCWWHARVVAGEVLDGTLTPARGNSELWALFINCDLAGELTQLNMVYEYEWDYGGPDDERLDARMRECAAEVLRAAEVRLR